MNCKKELHERLKLFDAHGWEWYSPNNWAPHITIALTHGDKNEAFYQASDLVMNLRK